MILGVWKRGWARSKNTVALACDNNNTVPFSVRTIFFFNCLIVCFRTGIIPTLYSGPLASSHRLVIRKLKENYKKIKNIREIYFWIHADSILEAIMLIHQSL